jgi:hypothetical protein
MRTWRIRWGVVYHVIRAVFRPGVIIVSSLRPDGKARSFSYALSTGTRNGDRALQKQFNAEYEKLVRKSAEERGL